MILLPFELIVVPAGHVIVPDPFVERDTAPFAAIFPVRAMFPLFPVVDRLTLPVTRIALGAIDAIGPSVIVPFAINVKELV